MRVPFRGHGDTLPHTDRPRHSPATGLVPVGADRYLAIVVELDMPDMVPLIVVVDPEDAAVVGVAVVVGGTVPVIGV